MRKKGILMGNSSPTSFVGIDVSKDTLDVGIRPSGEYFQIPNSPDGSGLTSMAQTNDRRNHRPGSFRRL